jgi:hypothetical protein
MEGNWNSMIVTLTNGKASTRHVTNIFKCYRVKRHDGVSFSVFVQLETSTNKILFTDFKPLEILGMDLVSILYFRKVRKQRITCI